MSHKQPRCLRLRCCSPGLILCSLTFVEEGQQGRQVRGSTKDFLCAGIGSSFLPLEESLDNGPVWGQGYQSRVAGFQEGVGGMRSTGADAWGLSRNTDQRLLEEQQAQSAEEQPGRLAGGVSGAGPSHGNFPPPGPSVASA